MGALLHIRRSFPFYAGKENPFLLPVSLSSPLAAVAEISVDEDEQRREEPIDAGVGRSLQSRAIGIVRELPSWSQD